jgi:hypothetical protein
MTVFVNKNESGQMKKGEMGGTCSTHVLEEIFLKDSGGGK